MAYVDTSIKPSGIQFTQDYADGSGVQYGVSYGDALGEGTVRVEANAGSCEFHIDHLEWFIERLKRIQAEMLP